MVLHISICGGWVFCLGAKPTKARRGDGTASVTFSTLAETPS